MSLDVFGCANNWSPKHFTHDVFWCREHLDFAHWLCCKCTTFEFYEHMWFHKLTHYRNGAQLYVHVSQQVFVCNPTIHDFLGLSINFAKHGSWCVTSFVLPDSRTRSWMRYGQHVASPWSHSWLLANGRLPMLQLLVEWHGGLQRSLAKAKLPMSQLLGDLQ